MPLVPKLYLGTEGVCGSLASCHALQRGAAGRKNSFRDRVKYNLGTRGDLGNEGERESAHPPSPANSVKATAGQGLRRGRRAVATGTSSTPLKAGFREVDVVLDAAEDFVVDGVFVAQGDDGVAFGFQGFTGQLLKVL